MLTLAGNATVAGYQSALRTVTYANTSDSPSTAARTVSIVVVDDGGAASPAATHVVTVTAVNDAPTLNAGAAVTLTGTDENTASAATAVGTLLTAAGHGDADGSASAGIAVTAASGNGSWQYATDGAGWTAFGSVSTSHALLLAAGTQLRYLPDAANGETATLSFGAWDRTSGVAAVNGAAAYADPGAGGGSSAYSIQRATATVVVTPVNDAPTLNNGAVVAVAGTNENTTSAGTAIATLLAAAGRADVDAGALAGLAVVATTGRGGWQYSTDGVAWTAVGSVSSANALLLGAGSQLRYVPDNDNGETATVGFVAWDQTSGTASSATTPRYAAAGPGGGGSAFSSQSATAAIVVTAVNDAPVLDAAAARCWPRRPRTAARRSARSAPRSPRWSTSRRRAGGVDNVTDVDTGALLGIAVTAADTANGSWFYTIDSGANWSRAGRRSATAAPGCSLPTAATRIYSSPIADCNGTLASAITFRAWDRSSGSNGALANTGAGGGSTASRRATDTASLVDHRGQRRADRRCPDVGDDRRGHRAGLRCGRRQCDHGRRHRRRQCSAARDAAGQSRHGDAVGHRGARLRRRRRCRRRRDDLHRNGR